MVWNGRHEGLTCFTTHDLESLRPHLPAGFPALALDTGTGCEWSNVKIIPGKYICFPFFSFGSLSVDFHRLCCIGEASTHFSSHLDPCHNDSIGPLPMHIYSLTQELTFNLPSNIPNQHYLHRLLEVMMLWLIHVSTIDIVIRFSHSLACSLTAIRKPFLSLSGTGYDS